MADELERQLAKLQHGDHLCPICESDAERMAIAVAFVKDGLARGERCLYIGDESSAASVVRSLAAAGVDVPREREWGRLQFLDGSYLPGGEFEPHAMIAFWRRAEAEALAAGHAGLRAIGDVTWVVGTEIDSERFIEYEALLDRYLADSRTVILCQYGRSRFDPDVIDSVLRTHPVVILGDQVCPNPYYEPAELLWSQESRASSEREAKRVEWRVTQLRRARAAALERERMLEQVEFDRARLEAILRRRAGGHDLFDLYPGCPGTRLAHPRRRSEAQNGPAGRAPARPRLKAWRSGLDNLLLSFITMTQR